MASFALLRPEPPDTFANRYERLLRWALRLTRENRELARELVHDAFVHFAQRGTHLPAVQDTDAYLHGLLKKLHLSHLRRSAHRVMLPILEFDSAELALRAAPDEVARVHARLELVAVCRWACERKQASKSASVLILRFVWGLYPEEIARMLRCAPRTVSQWLWLARAEAAARVRGGGHRPQAGLHARGADTTETTADCIRLLQNMVEQSVTGACVTVEELDALYASPHHTTSSGPDCDRLAHIVSCAACLAQVAARVDIDDPSGRYPTDTLGVSPRGGGPRAMPLLAPRAKERQHHERRMQELARHEPQALEVIVNGFVLGTHRISGGACEQVLRVSLSEAVSFVEVFSEQGVRLLFLDVVAPPEGHGYQEAEVELATGRTLGVAVAFADPWPSVHLRYVDTSWSAATEPDAVISDAGPAVAAASDQVDTTSPRLPKTHEGRGGLAAWISRGSGPWWAWRFAGAMLLLWLLFFTPFTSVSAAERIAQAVQWLIHRVLPMRERSSLDAVPVLPTARVTVPLSLPALSSPVPYRSWQPSLTAAEVLALEIDVLGRLDARRALMGEAVRIERTAAGAHAHLRVTATVDEAARARELETALRPLGLRGVEVAIQSAGAATMASPRDRPSALIVREISLGNQSSAAAPLLRAHLAASSASDLDAAMQRCGDGRRACWTRRMR